MHEPRRALTPDEEFTDSPEDMVTDEPGMAVTADSPGTGTAAGPGASRPPWRSLLRFGRGQVVVAIVLFLTALLVAVTIRAQSTHDVYDNMRRDELVQLLDNASSQTRRLEAEARDLQGTRDDLASGAAGAEAAEAEAQRRLEQLQILAGTVPAVGPGIRITIEDPTRLVTPEILLNGVEELRDAGAEVLEFNDSIRMAASSWLALDDQGRLVLDGSVIERPIIIDAIGDPATLEAGARFRGGLVSEIEGPRVGGRVTIEQAGRIEVTAVVEPEEPQHARPR